eukprot:gb/GECG01000090.1/.p1 GENE.gb/GECG01000090.1/~~gb/GECG01000090.1/.p1  ORF type:complete len:572 (+),score=141.51 gb/GECG01000090.1/:1-1716(+)
MMHHHYLMLKPWHPTNKNNQRRLYEAEAQYNERKKNEQEARAELDRNLSMREQQEMLESGSHAGLGSGSGDKIPAKGREALRFMYAAPPGMKQEQKQEGQGLSSGSMPGLGYGSNGPGAGEEMDEDEDPVVKAFKAKFEAARQNNDDTQATQVTTQHEPNEGQSENGQRDAVDRTELQKEEEQREQQNSRHDSDDDSSDEAPQQQQKDDVQSGEQDGGPTSKEKRRSSSKKKKSSKKHHKERNRSSNKKKHHKNKRSRRHDSSSDSSSDSGSETKKESKRKHRSKRDGKLSGSTNPVKKSGTASKEEEDLSEYSSVIPTALSTGTAIMGRMDPREDREKKDGEKNEKSDDKKKKRHKHSSELERVAGRKAQDEITTQDIYERFPWLKNAPVEAGDTDNKNLAFRPMGMSIRNVRCIRCGQWGHQTGDRECPMRDTNPNDADRLRKEDPLSYTQSGGRRDFELDEVTAGALGIRYSGNDEDQDLVHSDDEDYAAAVASSEGRSVKEAVAEAKRKREERKKRASSSKMQNRAQELGYGPSDGTQWTDSEDPEKHFLDSLSLSHKKTTSATFDE